MTANSKVTVLIGVWSYDNWSPGIVIIGDSLRKCGRTKKIDVAPRRFQTHKCIVSVCKTHAGFVSNELCC